jgi:hypothetical protein
MDQPSLSSQLEGKNGFPMCEIVEKHFLPLDILDAVISEHNVKVALNLTDEKPSWASMVSSYVGIGSRAKPPSSDLPRRVTEHAKKIFAALLLMDKPEAIHGLLNEGLTDDHLPLARCPESESVISSTNATYPDPREGEKAMTFAFQGWADTSINDFLRDKQWLLLAPVLEANGQLSQLHQHCPLPFVKGEEIGGGAAGIVHRAWVHKAHQRGLEVSAPTFVLNYVTLNCETLLNLLVGDDRSSGCCERVPQNRRFQKGE